MTERLTIKTKVSLDDHNVLLSSTIKSNPDPRACLFDRSYFWLQWVSVATQGLSLVAVSGGCSPVVGQGLPIAAAPLSQRTGSKVRGLSSCTACGIFPDQRSSPQLQHWPAYV